MGSGAAQEAVRGSAGSQGARSAHPSVGTAGEAKFGLYGSPGSRTGCTKEGLKPAVRGAETVIDGDLVEMFEPSAVFSPLTHGPPRGFIRSVPLGGSGTTGPGPRRLENSGLWTARDLPHGSGDEQAYPRCLGGRAARAAVDEGASRGGRR
jgi:hypothetical protein